ncbi:MULTISPECIES: GntR family transcriptional regulator [unclassified Streptomyces]|uniref:GntR family transcriptional regulator n=1 Tax=unclassified Streptomyces TaxID=2593676 RepID=UPI0033A387B1
MGNPNPGTPAEVPRYLRIATSLREEIAERRIPPGSRLPSERSLSQHYQVNRQTVRSALELLRRERVVITDRRGTFAADPEAESPTAVPKARRRTFPGGPWAPETQAKASLTWETPPPSLTRRLQLASGEEALVHRHVVLGREGQVLQRAVSWFSRTALKEIPQLARYRRVRDRNQHPDLRHLYHWMRQAGLRVIHQEAVGVSTAPAGEAARLAVHRMVSDHRGQVLEITEIDVSASWMYEFSA